jgi:apolipoprotein N-acyltransferase
LPSGEVEKALPQFEKGNLILSVEPHEGLTPFARWGSGPVILVSLLLSLPSITSTAASVVRKIGIKAQR